MERFISLGKDKIKGSSLIKAGLRHPYSHQADIERKVSEEPKTLYLEEEVNDTSIQRLVDSFREVNKNDPNQDITLRINSDGGYVASVLKMITQMQHLSNPIQTITETNAYSSAALILASGTPGNRYAYSGARIMIHQAQIEINNWKGSIPSLLEFCEEKKRGNTLLLEAFATATGKSFEEIERDTKKDFYLTAEEAVDYGIIDHVIPRPERMIASATLLKLT